MGAEASVTPVQAETPVKAEKNAPEAPAEEKAVVSTKAEANDVKLEPKPEMQPEVAPETKANAKTDEKSEKKPDGKSNEKSDEKSDVKSEADLLKTDTIETPVGAKET